ncbi:S-formylglutathione hydrolase [Undibacterium sp. CY7W]|uniref:S-formylglutathione hydrolase n=1 Tax=Undibacterium rugosum TaxID=2762291 RepID=A0A923KZ78_9BURK|nr:S-formylglutathione hydrolase [Undibacterium rugosum]MBC3934596.1 S-formylglutathione hydrolase [Undibacterium rugosum]
MSELISEHLCFGGVQRFYRHASQAIGLPMRFSVYLPPQAQTAAVPALFYLAGLTCTEETFMIKAGAQRIAAQLGLALICPDTSPRGAGVAGEAEHWDLGLGAGFYLDASQQRWATHYRMQSYLTELHALVNQHLPVIATQTGIMGHSMGGHGALVTALRQPALFRSVSAIAPICAPTDCPWGEKAFQAYLGPDRQSWEQYDASCLMRERQTPFPAGILIDQGLSDQFLATQLHPERLEQACLQAAQPLTLRRHMGYDHGYYFIASVIEDHLRFHYERLSA